MRFVGIVGFGCGSTCREGERCEREYVVCISILGYKLLMGWGSCLGGSKFCVSGSFCNN